jgi:hypothetical protein
MLIGFQCSWRSVTDFSNWFHGISKAIQSVTRCAIITIAWSGAGSGKAEVVNVSLSDNLSPTLNGPSGGVGSYWNGWKSAGNSLVNSSGIGTQTSFATDAEGPHGDWWCDLELLSGGVHVPPGMARSLEIKELSPGGTYDLYLASSWGTKGESTMFSMTNISKTPPSQIADNQTIKDATRWRRGVNFVFFQEVVPDPNGRIRISYSGGSFGILNGFQLVGPIERPTTTYDIWAADPAQGLTANLNDGPLEDPNNNGVLNLVEFALCGQPAATSSAILPAISSAGGAWMFEYDRNDASKPPFTVQIVEYTNDFVIWTPVNIPVISDGSVTITDNGSTDHVRVTIPNSGKAVFARLKVVR